MHGVRPAVLLIFSSSRQDRCLPGDAVDKCQTCFRRRGGERNGSGDGPVWGARCRGLCRYVHEIAGPQYGYSLGFQLDGP